MIDARGYSCPMPVVMVQKEVKKSAPDTLEVLVDDPCAVENITRFAITIYLLCKTEQRFTVVHISSRKCRMTIQCDGRKRTLQIFSQDRSKFLIFSHQLFREVSLRLTRHFKALHQFAHNMFSIRS